MFKVADSYLPSSSLQPKSGVSHLLMCGLEFESLSKKWFFSWRLTFGRGFFVCLLACLLACMLNLTKTFFLTRSLKLVSYIKNEGEMS